MRDRVHNADSAAAANAAVAAWLTESGSTEFALQDMIADLGHWLVAHPEADHGCNPTLRAACERACMHFEMEHA